MPAEATIPVHQQAGTVAADGAAGDSRGMTQE